MKFQTLLLCLSLFASFALPAWADNTHGSGEPPTMNHGPGPNSKQKPSKSKRAKKKAVTKDTSAPATTTEPGTDTSAEPPKQ